MPLSISLLSEIEFHVSSCGKIRSCITVGGGVLKIPIICVDLITCFLLTVYHFARVYGKWLAETFKRVNAL